MIQAKIFSIYFVLVSLMFYSLGAYLMILDASFYVEVSFMYFNSVNLSFVLFFDWTSMIFMSFVFFISSVIMDYTGEYMGFEENLPRFVYLMVMFVFSMFFMVFSVNLISILLGWDGLGLVSYALVIYYQNIKSFNAGMLTALLNRLGDASLLILIGLTMDLGSWNLIKYSEVLDLGSTGLFIVLAAITKSAQIPFSSWLPAAMAAPTPVSSLVHSSTLVTAGVYLLLRFSSFSQGVVTQLSLLALATSLMAGLGASWEYDLKKIVALSTLSQLGFMIFLLSLGSLGPAFFHLLMHALFKALLFMCAGAIIHNQHGSQDIRLMGGVLQAMPFTSTCFIISSSALMGVPFLSGFYSKDLMAEVFSMKFYSMAEYSMFYMSIGATVAYSVRLFLYLFWEFPRAPSLLSMGEEPCGGMFSGMLKLVVLVVFMGSSLSWLMFSTPYFIFLPPLMKLFTMAMIFIGGACGLELNVEKFFYAAKCVLFVGASKFMSSMWNLPILSSGLNPSSVSVGGIMWKSVDQGWLEFYGSKNLFGFMLKLLSFNHNLLLGKLGACFVTLVCLSVYFYL
uniref:NADH-ubiquinone oxidoreductase chain 5 n=1 Tax=Scolytus schevyrewi TaxID=1158787 RepID=A0A6G6C8U2_9CUCU|nr:NADH dehydrogenase subunit 5 [Scolytus schevyrewi]QID77578.1 NADH dehydrogenase subunit 5 [Scolytus schevyrewi]